MRERWSNRGCRMASQHFHLITFQAKVTGSRDSRCFIAAPHGRGKRLRLGLRPVAREGSTRRPWKCGSLELTISYLHIPTSLLSSLYCSSSSGSSSFSAVFVVARSLGWKEPCLQDPRRPLSPRKQCGEDACSSGQRYGPTTHILRASYVWRHNQMQSSKESFSPKYHCNISSSTRRQYASIHTTKANATLQASSSRSPL